MSTANIEIVADLTEVKVHSPEWHALRRAGIGGSDAGAIVGVNKYKTAYNVWVDKVTDAPPPDDAEEPEYITWGKLLEEPVRDEFSRRTGIEVIPFPRMVRNTDHPWMLANVDGLTGAPTKIEGVYEGKTSRFDWLDEGTVEVPLEYAVQGQHYLSVLGLDVVHYACLVGGQKLRVAEIERNDSLIDDLIAIEEVFWQRVLEVTPPPVAAGDKRLLAQLYPGEADVVADLDDEVVAALQARNAVDADIKVLETRRDEYDARIMQALGNATVGKWHGTTVVTWKPQTRNGLDTAALKAAHPALAREFSKTSTLRKFLPKEITR